MRTLTSNQIQIEDVFHLQDGRTVLVGRMDDDIPFIYPRPAELWMDGDLCGVIRLEGEEVPLRSNPRAARPLRAVSTRDEVRLSQQDIQPGRFTLRLIRETHHEHEEVQMHRHLVGLDSPPADYVPDPMTLGPLLPEGWDGDAWVMPEGGGYFLRAWNKPSARVAYGRGSTYQEARQNLLHDVTHGKLRVVIEAREVSSV